jgi:hypothetical protein
MIFGVAAGTCNPLALAEGADFRPSTSKFQFLLWTAATVFSYVATYVARYPYHPDPLLAEFPRNVLIAMGLSITTVVGAKGITVSYLSNGRIVKSTPQQMAAAGQRRTSQGFAALVQDDDGVVDLTKVQMLAWTFIALFIYLRETKRLVGLPTGPTTLADIDGSLMVLMGLGQGAYLGKKLVAIDVPRLTRVDKAAGTVTIDGEGLGSTPGTVLLDGFPLQSQTWTETRLTFDLPAQHPSGQAWPAGGVGSRTVQMSVLVGGQSSNTLPLAVP